MPKSIRITDELYELATLEAELMQRSLAQQIEHWVKLGVGVERSSGATVENVRSAALRYRHVLDEASVISGRRPAATLHAIPPSIAKGAKVKFPKSAFSNRR